MFNIYKLNIFFWKVIKQNWWYLIKYILNLNVFSMNKSGCFFGHHPVKISSFMGIYPFRTYELIGDSI